MSDFAMLHYQTQQAMTDLQIDKIYADMDLHLGRGMIIPPAMELVCIPGKSRCDYCDSVNTESVNCCNCGAPR